MIVKRGYKFPCKKTILRDKPVYGEYRKTAKQDTNACGFFVTRRKVCDRFPEEPLRIQNAPCGLGDLSPPWIKQRLGNSFVSKIQLCNFVC